MSNLIKIINSLILVLVMLSSWAWGFENHIDEQVVNDFGGQVSIDGDTAIIGAYIFTRVNDNWIEQQKLTANDDVDLDNIWLSSVALSGDTAVIGVPNDGDNSGSVYVFTRSDGVWSQEQKLTAIDGSVGDQFGHAVAISGDTTVIGGTNYGLNLSGSVYVFTRSDGVWSQEQKLTAIDGSVGDQFGHAVAISGDAAVVGAWGDDDNGSRSGSAYVFARNSSIWAQQQKLTASDADEGDWFGYSVTISGDTALIGAWREGEDLHSGSAYVFTRSDSVWAEQQKLIASDVQYDKGFGQYLSISDNSAIIGAGGGATNSSEVYIFSNINGLWEEQLKIIPSNSEWLGFQYITGVSVGGDLVIITEYNNGAISYFYNLFRDTPASVAGDVLISLPQGESTTGTLLATDIDGLTDYSYFTISTPPVHGQAIINQSSGFWVYIGDPLYAGLDPFTVTVTDDLGGATEQIISIIVTGMDTDGDTIYDPSDNCPNTGNSNQANLDGDAFGDACDSDIDGDGVDNTLDAFPNDSTESADSDSDNVGDNSDNCVNDANFDQSDIDSDTLGDACDPDMDGDGVFNVVELRFGGNETDNTDASVSQNNIVTFSETAPADSDLDGVPDDVEAMLGEDNTSSTFQDLLDTLSTIATAKNVPAMGGIGLLALGLSMLGLGAVRLRRK